MQTDTAVISDIAYDETHAKLLVRFDSGETYVCVGVPPEAHRALASAPSRPRYFNSEILGVDPYNRLEG